ncbi:hypothetical protein D3C86_1724860 [compost metagenome]
MATGLQEGLYRRLVQIRIHRVAEDHRIVLLVAVTQIQSQQHCHAGTNMGGFIIRDELVAANQLLPKRIGGELYGRVVIEQTQ